MPKPDLKQYNLFADLSAQDINNLHKICIKKEFPANSIIFNADDPAESIFFVQKGVVNLIKSSTEGKEQLIRKVKVGEVFAEAAMFSGKTYPVSAITKVNCQLILINKSDFVRLIKDHPEISLKMMGTMANLLRHLNQLIAEMSLGSVSSRLSLFLLKCAKRAEKNKFNLDISKKELAFQLSTTPETLSRTLKKMQNSGIIQLQKNTILIKNEKKLTSFLT